MLALYLLLVFLAKSYRKVERTGACYSCLHAVAIFHHSSIYVIPGNTGKLWINSKLIVERLCWLYLLHIPSLEFPGEKWHRWMKMVKYCYCMQARKTCAHSFYLSIWLCVIGMVLLLYSTCQSSDYRLCTVATLYNYKCYFQVFFCLWFVIQMVCYSSILSCSWCYKTLFGGNLEILHFP